jgi:hypothetical protein
MIGIAVHNPNTVQAALVAFLFVICALVWFLAEPITVDRPYDRPCPRCDGEQHRSWGEWVCKQCGFRQPV